MRVQRHIAVLVAVMATATASFAAEPDKPFAAPQVAEHAPASTAGSLAQVTLSLLLVLAAVFAAAWVVRRLRGVGKLGTGAIEILADTPLGTKERAVLVRVGNQQLLLGVAPGQVTTLHVLPDPVVLSQPVDSGAQLRPDFKAILKRSLGL